MKNILSKTVVLAGNPNVGKSTLFNQLTGRHQKIANYPGVTVEKNVGQLVTESGQNLNIIDLPGTYSLNTKTEDEAIAVDYIKGEKNGVKRPNAVVVVVEASKLKRALLLCLQIKRIHPHIILVVNMMDELEQFKMSLDVKKLSQLLDVPVVSMVAKDGKGVCELITEIEKVPLFAHNDPEETPAEHNHSVENIEDDYKTIDHIVQHCMKRSGTEKNDFSEKLDKVFLHGFFGPFLFLAVMFVLFEALFTWSGPLMDVIDGAFGTASETVAGLVTTPWLSSLLTDGIIAGVGSIVIFVPQIAIAFIFIGVLEMSGYLARGSFLIDRMMRFFGLEGRAFIPLISSFACAIPGIMGTRSMPNPRQRLITMLIAPLMTCAARLPVYILLIATFIPATKVFGFFNLQGLTMFGLFCAGVIGAMFMAYLFNKFLPKTAGVDSFLMELPRYRTPSLKVLTRYVSQKVWAFLKTAGTIIFFLSMILWTLAYFPRSESITQRYEAERLVVTQSEVADAEKEELIADIDSKESGELLRESYMGKMGRFIEPTLAPMGFDWKMGIGIIASFAAREVFVSTMGIVFNLGEADEESQSLREKILSAKKPDGSQAYTLATALSLMIFFAFAAQCISTIGVIKRETNSTKWAVFAFVYMTVLAYIASTIVYQVTAPLV